MELVKAERIIFGAGGRAGLARNEIDGDLFLDLRDALSRRLREGWEFAKWGELVRIEKRYFRKVWSTSVAGDVTAGSEWYHPESELYFVALKVTTNAPWEDGETHADWAELEAEQAADDWASDLSYDPGDKVFYPITESYYQCHSASAAGVVPTNASFWGEVPDFDRYVALEQELANGDLATEIGTVFRATRKNPRTVGRSERAVSLTHWRSENGIQIDEEEPWAWLEFRLRPPVLDGELYVSTDVYEEGEAAYFDGDFWGAIEDAGALESPETHPAKWEKKEIPLFLERFLVHALFADYLEMDGQKEKSEAEEMRAYAELGRLRMIFEGQEGSVERAEVFAR